MPTSREDLRTRKRLLRRSIANEQAAVRDILTRVRAETDRIIMKAAQDPKFATSAAARNRMYADLTIAYENMSATVIGWADGMVKSQARTAFRAAKKELAGMVSENFGTFSEKHLRDYIGYVHPHNASQLASVNSMNATEQRWLRRQFSAVMREAAATGKTMADMRDTLRARITGTKPDWKFVDRSGREWDPGRYFSMLTRTTVAEVDRQATMDTMADANVDLALVAGGTPTSPPPDPCWRWYGKIVSISGKTKGYPSVAEARDDGMFHPNCIHFLAPIIPEDEKAAKKIETKTNSERAEKTAKATAAAEARKEADKAELAAKG